MDLRERRGMQKELTRIKFRARVLSMPGGSEWLCHIGRLFGFNSKFMSPGNFGFPPKLALLLFDFIAGRKDW